MDFDPFALSLEGCDEDTSKKLMNLQFNANKLHIEFHQKAVALRTKYEANLEMVFQALKVHNNKLRPNYNKSFQSVQTETNKQTDMEEEKESFDEDDEEEEALQDETYDSETSRDDRLPRNFKSLKCNQQASSNNNNNKVIPYRVSKNNTSSHNNSKAYQSAKNRLQPASSLLKWQGDFETNRETPCFWLKVFLNSKYTLNKIQVCDQAPLQSMTNLKVNSDLSHLESDKAYKFILEFSFRKNDYFTNQVLTKEYFVQLKTEQEPSKKVNSNNNSRYPDLDLPGAAYVQCRGCQIDWKPGMNITEIEVRSEKRSRPVIKRSYKKSFFNFFSPPVFDITEELSPKKKRDIENDYIFGLHLKEKVIPRAICYYMGDNCDEKSNNEDSSESSIDSSVSATSASRSSSVSH